MRSSALILAAALACAATPAAAQSCDANLRNNLGDAAALRGLGMAPTLAADTATLYATARFDTADYAELQARIVETNKAMMALVNARSLALELQATQAQLQHTLDLKANKTNTAVSHLNAVIATQCGGK
jgi:hypothetical protein